MHELLPVQGDSCRSTTPTLDGSARRRPTAAAAATARKIDFFGTINVFAAAEPRGSRGDRCDARARARRLTRRPGCLLAARLLLSHAANPLPLAGGAAVHLLLYFTCSAPQRRSLSANTSYRKRTAAAPLIPERGRQQRSAQHGREGRQGGGTHQAHRGHG